MVSSLGRPLFRAVPFFIAGVACTLVLPSASSAQDWDDEVIVDPELDDSGESPGLSEGEEEVIVDPELEDDAAAQEPSEDDYGWGSVYKPPGQPESSMSGGSSDLVEEYDPLANTGLAKIEIAAQTAFDINHEANGDPAGGLEDAYETRLRFGGEIEFRRSRKLRLVFGSRVDFFWAVPSHNDSSLGPGESALDEDRFEVDILPTAAYLDWTIFEGGHLRVGHQVITMGRLDFVSATDVLTVYDMRPQPTVNPAAMKLAQPAVRLDWDLSTKLTLEMAYVPWFTPNLMRPNRDKFVATTVAGPGTAALPDKLDGIFDPSFQTQSAEANVRFVGPAPDFTTPQAQVRLELRTLAAEFAITAGTALEKIPAYYYTNEVEEFLLCDPNLPANMPMPAMGDEGPTNGRCNDLQSILGLLNLNGFPVFDAEFHRYYLVGADVGFDVGPVRVAMEGAFSPERHLYAATTDGSRLPIPNTTEEIGEYPGEATAAGVSPERNPELRNQRLTDENIRKGVPVAQGGLHVEYLRGQSLVLAAELFWVQALGLPHASNRQWLGFKEDIAALYGGLVAASYLIDDGTWRIDLSLVASNGPAVALMPHVEYRAMEGLFLDAGAQIIEGGNPGVNGSAQLNFGGLYSGYDQVFVGLRWLP